MAEMMNETHPQRIQIPVVQGGILSFQLIEVQGDLNAPPQLRWEKLLWAGVAENAKLVV